MYHTEQTRRHFLAPGTSLPHRSKIQPPVDGSFYSSVHPGTRLSHTSYLVTPPTSSPFLPPDTVTSLNLAPRSLGTALYTLDNGLRDEPGTVAYYTSWKFRQKVDKGTTIVPREGTEAGESLDDRIDEVFMSKAKHVEKKTSLIMVFSRTSVRRACTQRKVNRRMQRTNRRMKLMRRLEKTVPLFDWD